MFALAVAEQERDDEVEPLKLFCLLDLAFLEALQQFNLEPQPFDAGETIQRLRPENDAADDDRDEQQQQVSTIQGVGDHAPDDAADVAEHDEPDQDDGEDSEGSAGCDRSGLSAHCVLLRTSPLPSLST